MKKLFRKNFEKVIETHVRTYSYSNDGRISGYTISGDFTSNTIYNYDVLDRLSSVVYNNIEGRYSFTISKSYSYLLNSPTCGETSLVEAFTSTVGDTTVRIRTLMTMLVICTDMLYTVNADGSLGADLSPNISHSYFNSEWGDQLTSFWSNTITYDEIGNPTSYYNGEYMYFGWDGRTMTSASTMTTDYVFTYYENGLRKTKTDVQGIMSYEYVYDGTTLVMETFVDLYTILYIYDANGSPIGFRCREVDYASGVWDVYWYEKNPFGDIVAIYSSTGQKLISYEYDPWGNFTTTNHTGASTTARYNSLKYRGYYYDDDFNMYYLQSRYYDPATCRFISPDSLMSGVNGSLHGFNLYAYCFNNPLSYTDSQGNWPKWMEDAYEWVENKRDEAKEVWNEVTEWVENKVSEIGTYSTGLSISGTYDHIVVNVQIGLSIDKEGHIEGQISISSGVSTSDHGWFVGGYHTVTNAPTVKNLEGPFTQAGGSAGIPIGGTPIAGGVDVLKMVNDRTGEIYHGASVSGGVGSPGAEVHFETGRTFSFQDIIAEFIKLSN